MVGKIGISFPLRNNSFQVLLTSESKQLLAAGLDVVAVQKTFACFRNDLPKSLFTINQRQVSSVLPIAKSPHLHLIVRPGVLVP